MSATPDSNPSAFPYVFHERQGTPIQRVVVIPGMTLRDYFAAKALAVFSMTETEIRDMQDGAAIPDHSFTAKFCYDLADAMLKQRAKQ